jgi:hypothetical protein
MTLPGQVEEPSRCPDDDVDARQGIDLGLVRAAAIERDDVGAELLARYPQVVSHLDGQFACRHDHESTRGRGLSAGLAEALQDRDAEREGLAGARPGLADEVMAVQRDGQSKCLDREGGGDALGFQSCANRLGDAEVPESLDAGINLSGGRLTGRALISRVRTQGSRLQ